MFFVLVYVLVCLFCSSLLYIYRYRLFLFCFHITTPCYTLQKKKRFFPSRLYPEFAVPKCLYILISIKMNIFP